MLNVIATGTQYPHSLTVETSVYAGINGVRALKNKSVAMVDGTEVQTVSGVLKDSPYVVNTPNMRLMTLSCSAPIAVALTRNDNTVVNLTVSRILTIDESFKSISLVFTPSGEITQCQYNMSWMQQAT